MAIDTSQLPPGAQKAVGNTSYPVGVLQEGYIPEGVVLAQQAQTIAAQRGYSAPALPTNPGGQLTDDVIERVQTIQGINPMIMSRETLQGVVDGKITRDQAFVGNNANFTGYYLEPAAKYVIPQYTPLRNMLPRLPGPGIDTINWRAITDYFGGSGPSVATAALQQQSTPSSLSYVWVNASNVFKMLALKDIVTFEAEIYGKSFEGDVRAAVAAKLIPALMLEEEMWLINSGQRCWAPAPVFNLSTATTGGTVAAATNWIVVTAVNANGETLAFGGTSPTGDVTASGTAAIPSIVTTGSTSTVTISIPRVPSATKYNVYVGTGSTVPATSAFWLQSATTQFGGATALNDTGGFGQGYITVTATAAWATSGTAYSTLTTNTAIVVKSTDSNTLNLPLTYDGIQALIYLNSGAANTAGVQGETPLIRQPAASSGSLALSDIDSLLEAMYLNAHADPEVLLVGVKDHKKLSYLVSQGTNFRVTQQMEPQGLSNLIASQRVTKYINQTTGKLMDVIMLPYLTQGTIIAASLTLPFPVSAITRPPLRVEYNREMWAVEYPPDQSHTTQWMYSAYMNVAPVIQYLGGMALLNGISLS
jgi:hypothetical protein